MNFATRLKELRKENHLDREDLANKFNLSYSAIAKYETGIRTPDDDTKKAFAKYFNVSLDYLMGESNIRNPYIVDEYTTGDTEGFIIRDEKYSEIHDVEEAMKIILDQPGLMLKGELLSDESKIILANAIQMGLRTAEELEKKSKGEANE